ncbi:hypothetical protein SAMN05421824_0627 [Hyunsoonleella jejuensis]|uniref:Uncharacterized protein n=1 Tax=Hyunsoonleella jejuensis TaxID=419940 RepID=A0A1H9BM37_9FLAO|nr:hypothetical protein [Hyunsoonleella jejuensis]SEP89807.1 hypothetical protein SAMN05421824_0627 [Hyunsoonleella jejuensis]
MKIKLLFSFLLLLFFVLSGNSNTCLITNTNVNFNCKKKDTGKDGILEIIDLGDDSNVFMTANTSVVNHKA